MMAEADPVLMVQLVEGSAELAGQLPKNFKLGDAFEVVGILVVESITQTPDHAPNTVILAMYDPVLKSAPNYKPTSAT
jgi:hypothetical protein